MAAARAGAACAPMSARRVWISAIRCGSCAVSASLQQCGALAIGGEHHLDQAFRSVWGFLRKAAEAPARRDGDLPGFGRNIAANGLKQRRLSRAVASDQADARAWHDLRGGVIDQQPSGDPDRDVGEGRACGLFTASTLQGNRFVEPSVRRQNARAEPSLLPFGGSRPPRGRASRRAASAADQGRRLQCRATAGASRRCRCATARLVGASSWKSFVVMRSGMTSSVNVVHSQSFKLLRRQLVAGSGRCCCEFRKF